MSFRATRVGESRATAFTWVGDADTAPSHIFDAPPPPETPEQEARFAALERDAFAKGYAQGERAGMEAGGQRAQAMLRRLGQTLEELGGLRRTLIQQTERQMVQLALAVAQRIIRREVSLDRDFVVAMARVAMDRLGNSAPATIRLHPEDYSGTIRQHGEAWAGSNVQLVADTSVSRGGCLVESDFGYVDGSVDAQFDELARALVGGDGEMMPVAVAAAPRFEMASDARPANEF